MQVRTTKDLGAAIRDRRKKKGLDQGALAELVGVSRRWVNEVEQGKPRAEVSLILKTLDALGLAVDVRAEDQAAGEDSVPPVDIDAVIERAKARKR